MQIWKSLPEWRDRRRAIGSQSIGLVPTMGALHRGHASLIERCRRENEVAVATIFVNPSQFNDPRDLERYPRTLESDLSMLEELGVDDVLTPAETDLYPHGYRYRVELNGRVPVMEGAHRPGFLEGVMTVVLKLFHLVEPSRAYFGEKDYQQLRTLTEMTAEFCVPTEIVPCPTVRDAAGLAESSRNALLSPEGREKAAGVYRALTTARDVRDARQMLEREGFNIEYVEEHWGRRFAAVFLEGVRLIDNVPLP